MDKETQKKLTKDFPKSVVKSAPAGKFGDYVPHHIYTQRLVDVIGGGYDFTFEETRDKTGAIIGAKCRLYIKSTDQTIEEVGDVDMNAVKRNITESEILKLAVSDGIKRCCMRLGIGLELWTGGVTEEEHYAAQQPIQKTGTIKDVVIDKKEQESLEKAKQDFASDIESNPNNKQDLAKFMEATVKDEAKREQIKKDIYNDVVSKGFPKDVNDWDSSQLDIFKDLVFESNESNTKQSDIEIVEEVFGEVQDNSPKKCPQCNTQGNIEDNREKKASDPKFSKIPDFSCSQYGESNGCGWASWIGNDDCPTEWL
jgi:hypothetical protein